MKIRIPFISPSLASFGIVVAMASPLAADVVVSAPIAITKRVQIQPIRVKKTNGTAAVTFGDSTQSAYIMAQINRVWAQAGIRIDWLPFTEYTSNFAYDGSPASYTSSSRPDSDLDLIVDGAGAPPKSSNAIVVNVFFVDVVPGFTKLGDNYANGLAYVDSNGVAVHVGSNLPGFQAGRDVIAAVVAHEIGHNLGLDHVAQSADNLMSSPAANDQYLTTAQKNIVFTNNGGTDGYDFLQNLPAASNYQQWATTNGVSGGAEGDDDKDKIPNVIEFMLGLNPKLPSKLPTPVASAAGLTWTLTKNAGALADGLVYRVESSSNASAWLAAGTAGSGSTVVTDNASSLVVRLDAGGGKRFMRLNVNSSPVAAAAAAAFIVPEGSPASRVIATPEQPRFALPPENP